MTLVSFVALVACVLITAVRSVHYYYDGISFIYFSSQPMADGVGEVSWFNKYKITEKINKKLKKVPDTLDSRTISYCHKRISLWL